MNLKMFNKYFKFQIIPITKLFAVLDMYWNLSHVLNISSIVIIKIKLSYVKLRGIRITFMHSSYTIMKLRLFDNKLG